MSRRGAPSQLDELFAGLPEVDTEELAMASSAIDIARIAYQARSRRNLTQTEAAERTGMQQQAISRLEGGQQNITIGTLERYLRKLGYAVEVGLLDDETGDLVDRVVLNDSRERATSREAKQLLTDHRSVGNSPTTSASKSSLSSGASESSS